MAKRPKSLVGRLIVFVLFGSVVAYFGIAIFGSIVTDLYGQPPPDDTSNLGLRERTWCIRGIIGLRDELEGQVTLELQHPRRDGDPYARWRVWNEGWQDKLSTGRIRCVGIGNQPLDRAFERLTALHIGYTEGVEAMIKTRAEVANGLQESLRALKKQR